MVNKMLEMIMCSPELAGSPDLLAVPVHCGGGAAQHSHCSVQQEL